MTKPPTEPKETIQAGGGLVTRDTKAGKEILLVYRNRYGDWTLPKGKRKTGEALRETALREVKEETGYRAQITGFAGAIAYEVKGKPKVVSFWHMVAQGEPGAEIDSEVAEVVWLPIPQALQRLQYPLERSLVEALFF